jgi:hypothetical protein
MREEVRDIERKGGNKEYSFFEKILALILLKLFLAMGFGLNKVVGRDEVI